MNSEKLSEVETEMDRVRERIRALKTAQKRDDIKATGCYSGGKETAALKRATMDLSNALAELRRGTR